MTITRTGGFADPVGLSVSGLPAGATAAFSPNPVTGSSTLTVTTTTSTQQGNKTLTITGTGGGRTHTTAVTLAVKRK